MPVCQIAESPGQLSECDFAESEHEGFHGIVEARGELAVVCLHAVRSPNNRTDSGTIAIGIESGGNGVSDSEIRVVAGEQDGKYADSCVVEGMHRINYSEPIYGEQHFEGFVKV